MRNLFVKYTGGNPRILIAPTIWAFFENLTSSVPAIFVMLAMGTLINLIYPPYEADVSQLWLYCTLLGISIVVQGAVSVLTYRYSYYASQKAMGAMRLDMIEKMRRLPLGLYSKKESGDFVNAFVTDPDQLDQAMSFFIPQVISMGMLTALSAVMLFMYDWRLAIAMYLMVPVGLLLMKLAMGLKYRQAEKVAQARIHTSTLLNEYLLGMRNLKSYNQTGKGFARLDDAYEDLRRETTKDEGVPGAITLLAAHIINFGIPLIIFTGAMLLIAGTVDLFLLLAYLILSTRLYTPLATAITCVISLSAASVPADRVNTLLSESVQEGNERSVSTGDIVYDNVSFSYDENKKNDVLHEVSFTAKKQTVTALVGPSGCGKSTLLRLAARFWDVREGNVSLNGVSLGRICPEALFEQISMVFQDNYLFGGTIRDNILFGREGKSEEDMIQAAERAGCHSFISALPQKYDTVIGEGGATLSGGERQRVAIARAILKDAPVLLLDEPTSSLDAKSEAQVQRAIDELVQNKTVIMIAHRLKTVMNASQIIVLENGRVIQTGTHDELLEQKSGLYRHMWELQTQAQAWNIKN